MNNRIRILVAIVAVFALVVIIWVSKANVQLKADGPPGGGGVGAVIVGEYGGVNDPELKAKGSLQGTKVVFEKSNPFSECPTDYERVNGIVFPFMMKQEAVSLELDGPEGPLKNFNPVDNPGFPGKIVVGTSREYVKRTNNQIIYMIPIRNVERVVSEPGRKHRPNKGRGIKLGDLLPPRLGGGSSPTASYFRAADVVGPLQDGNNLPLGSNIAVCQKPGGDDPDNGS